MTGTKCGLFTHKSVPVIFEPLCIYINIYIYMCVCVCVRACVLPAKIKDD